MESVAGVVEEVVEEKEEVSRAGIAEIASRRYT
jgi:hypothetical protein